MAKELKTTLGHYWTINVLNKRQKLVSKRLNDCVTVKSPKTYKFVQVLRKASGKKEFKEVAVQTDTDLIFQKCLFAYNVECQKQDYFQALRLQSKEQITDTKNIAYISFSDNLPSHMKLSLFNMCVKKT